MKTQSFTIPLKCVSWNVTERMHFRAQAKHNAEWGLATMAAIRQAKIKKAETYPVRLEFCASWKSKRRRDADNMNVKESVDTLVDCGILIDDDTSHVASVTLSGAIGCPRDELLVTIREP